MPHFGTTSLDRLETCHPDLQKVMRAAIVAGPDFSIICGHRDEPAQNKAFAEGASKAIWPQSKHNTLPSNAVDIAPYPIDWDDTERFEALSKHVLAIANALEIELTWGGTWTDPVDMPHYELKEI